LRLADLSPQVPRAGADYPTAFGPFQNWLSTDDVCLEYLTKLYGPDGFDRPECLGTATGAHAPGRECAERFRVGRP